MDQRILEALILTSVPIMLPLLFRAGREVYGRAWRWIRRHTSSNGQVLAELKALRQDVGRVLHEVLPNNGGSMRDEMSRQHSMLLALFSDPDEGQFYTNRAGELIWAGETLRLWTGMSLRDLQGKGWLSVIAERDQDAFLRNFDVAIGHQREFRGIFALRVVTAPTDSGPGGVRHVRTEWRISVVRDDVTGALVGFKGNVRHIGTGQQSAVSGLPGAATA